MTIHTLVARGRGNSLREFKQILMFLPRDTLRSLKYTFLPLPPTASQAENSIRSMLPKWLDFVHFHKISYLTKTLRPYTLAIDTHMINHTTDSLLVIDIS